MGHQVRRMGQQARRTGEWDNRLGGHYNGTTGNTLVNLLRLGGQEGEVAICTGGSGSLL